MKPTPLFSILTTLALSLFTASGKAEDVVTKAGSDISEIICSEIQTGDVSIEQIIEMMSVAPDKLLEILTATITICPDYSAQLVNAATQANPTAAGEYNDIFCKIFIILKCFCLTLA